jgi:ABC-type sugar transport system permease subunit
VLPQYLLYITLTLLPFAIALPILFTDRPTSSTPASTMSGSTTSAPCSSRRSTSDSWPRSGDADLHRRQLRMVFAFGFRWRALFELKSRLVGLFFTVIYVPWMMSGSASACCC